MRFVSAILLAFSVFCSAPLLAQDDKDKKEQKEKSADEGDDLMEMLNKEEKGGKSFTAATFKTTRIVNGHSSENVASGVLDFKVSHRFGELKSGFDGFFGLDDANTLIGFDYGINDRIMIGVSRSTYDKEYAGFTKIKILRQRDDRGMPLTVSYMGAISIQSMKAPTLPAGQEYYFSNRMYYTNQLILARKFNQWLSLQLTPTHIHYNLVPTTAEPNDLIALGVGGRVKLTNRISLNAEYYHRFTELGNATTKYYNSFSLGFDIETGGHVFQLMFTNATAITERAFIGQNVSTWEDGGVHFGFNISRVFTIVKPKGFENSRNKVW